MKRRDEKMDIDNKKMELFAKFTAEVSDELMDLSHHQIQVLSLAFYAGFEKGFNLGYITSVEEYEDGRAEIPF